MEEHLKYKATLHFPVEQYGFAEVELEVSSPEEAIAAYKAATKQNEGLEKKSYDGFIDRYLMGEQNHVEDYEKMNDEQKMIVQTIKRSLKRIKSRQGE